MSRRLFYIIFGISWLFIAVAGLRAYGAFANVKHLLIVHFDAFRGIDFLGSRRDVFGIVLTAFAASALNFLLAKTFQSRSRFLAAAIAYSTLVFAVFVLAAISMIVANN